MELFRHIENAVDRLSAFRVIRDPMEVAHFAGHKEECGKRGPLLFIAKN